MKHYGIIEWVDFARGVSAVGSPPAMEAHLAGGCPSCQQLAEFFAKLTAVCGGAVLQPVPERALRQAQALFPAQPAVRAKRSFRIPFELIYDSLLVPSPAGLRSSWQVGWQALYRAGDCSVDLRVEPELHSSRAAIIGQVSSHVAPETEMSDLAVCLKSGKTVVAETRSNQFGEFQMEYEQQKRLQLCVFLESGGKTIQVPVKRLSTDTGVRAARTGKTKAARKGLG